MACAAVTAYALGVPHVLTVVAWGRAAAADTGPVTRVAIPAIEVDSKVVPVTVALGAQGRRWEVADFAVGHHEGSGAPGGGTNIVLAAHNNYRGEVFRRLDELVSGDLVRLGGEGGRWHDYRVVGTRIVLEDGASRAQRHDNAALLAPTNGEQVTLVSCWPYRSDPPYRVVGTALKEGQLRLAG